MKIIFTQVRAVLELTKCTRLIKMQLLIIHNFFLFVQCSNNRYLKTFYLCFYRTHFIPTAHFNCILFGHFCHTLEIVIYFEIVSNAATMDVNKKGTANNRKWAIFELKKK